MRIGVTGYRSNIIQEFKKQLDGDIDSVERLDNEIASYGFQKVSLDYDAYIFCAGYLVPKNIQEQTKGEKIKSLQINLISVIQMCEYILEHHENACIVIIGSESGIKGSYDTTYWMCKAAIHSYIENRKIKFPGQQLIGIAPSIIEDTKMTQDRNDLDTVLSKSKFLPKGRLLKSQDVADLLFYLLCSIDAPDYLTNTVIDMSGGKRAMS